MTELETQLLKIIEEQQQQLLQQQTQLKEQQQALNITQTAIMKRLSEQSTIISRDQLSLQQVQKLLSAMQIEFHTLAKDTVTYTELLNTQIIDVKKMIISNEDNLVKISNLQFQVSKTLVEVQQNLLEASKILKKSLSG